MKTRYTKSNIITYEVKNIISRRKEVLPTILLVIEQKDLPLVAITHKNSFSQFLGILEFPHNLKILNQIPAVKWQPKNKWFLSSTLARQKTQETELVRPHLRSLSWVANLSWMANQTIKRMSHDSLWKPNRMVPVYNWHSRSKMISYRAKSECPGRIKRPRDGVFFRDIKMIIHTAILDGHKVS